MSHKSDHIREIAPGICLDGLAVIDEALDHVTGAVSVLTRTGRHLGSASYRGVIAAEVVVEFDKPSRQSGGELYRLASVHTPEVDHYFIDSLPTIIREPVVVDNSQHHLISKGAR